MSMLDAIAALALRCCSVVSAILSRPCPTATTDLVGCDKMVGILNHRRPAGGQMIEPLVDGPRTATDRRPSFEVTYRFRWAERADFSASLCIRRPPPRNRALLAGTGSPMAALRASRLV